MCINYQDQLSSSREKWVWNKGFIISLNHQQERKGRRYNFLFHHFIIKEHHAYLSKPSMKKKNKKLPKHQQPYPMALDDTPNTLLQSPKLHGTCPLQQPQAFLHPEHCNWVKWNTHTYTQGEKTRWRCTNQITCTSCQPKKRKGKEKVCTLLTSVNSLNKSMLVAHGSSCSYPNPVTRRDCSTLKQEDKNQHNQP